MDHELEDRVEKIAEAVHGAWMKGKAKQGFHRPAINVGETI